MNGEERKQRKQAAMASEVEKLVCSNEECIWQA